MGTSTNPFTLPPAHADVDTHIAAYPDLDRVGQHSGRCSPLDLEHRASNTRARAVDAVYVSVGDRFPQHRDQTRPIEQWIHHQQLSAARRTQPDPRERNAG